MAAECRREGRVRWRLCAEGATHPQPRAERSVALGIGNKTQSRLKALRTHFVCFVRGQAPATFFSFAEKCLPPLRHPFRVDTWDAWRPGALPQAVDAEGRWPSLVLPKGTWEEKNLTEKCEKDGQKARNMHSRKVNCGWVAVTPPPAESLAAARRIGRRYPLAK